MITRRVNLNDIANKTRLSITTVSRVLSGKAEQYRISKKSQQIIRDAAEELDYIPNHFAANLKSGKSNSVAIIVPSLMNPFFAILASELNSEIRRFNYISIIGDSDESCEIEKLELQQMVSRNIEGLIIAPCGDQYEHIKKLHELGLPIVCIDRYFEDLDIPYVSTDNYDGAYTATKYLIENGHSMIACIQGVQQSTPNRLRVKGFKDAMDESGIRTYNVVGDDFTIQNGYLETKLLLEQKQLPTAIFSLSNTIAMGCIKALKEKNLMIPKDISIITFDEHPYQDYLEIPLTCIAQPVSDISKIAVKFLISGINGSDHMINQVLLKPEMKIKNSVRRLI